MVPTGAVTDAIVSIGAVLIALASKKETRAAITGPRGNKGSHHGAKGKQGQPSRRQKGNEGQPSRRQVNKKAMEPGAGDNSRVRTRKEDVFQPRRPGRSGILPAND